MNKQAQNLQSSENGSGGISDYFEIVKVDRRGRPLELKPLNQQDNDLPALARSFTGAAAASLRLAEKSLEEILKGEEITRDVVVALSYKDASSGDHPDAYSKPGTYPIPGVFVQ